MRPLSVQHMLSTSPVTLHLMSSLLLTLRHLLRLIPQPSLRAKLTFRQTQAVNLVQNLNPNPAPALAPAPAPNQAQTQNLEVMIRARVRAKASLQLRVERTPAPTLDQTQATLVMMDLALTVLMRKKVREKEVTPVRETAQQSSKVP